MNNNIEKSYNPYVDGGYYDITKDLEKNKDCWAILVVGGRKTGKTYSTLKYLSIDNEFKFAFIRRTNDDVKAICTNSKLLNVSLSPFEAINRDFHTNIKPKLIQKGIGAFYEANAEGEPIGIPLAHIFSLNAMGDVKGVEASEDDFMVLDEFIPNVYDRVDRREGEKILDMYATISRDRELRGKPPLRLVALANATRISNPLFEVLEIVDDIVDIKRQGKTTYKKNGIFVRLLDDNEEFKEKDLNTLMMSSMQHTAWGKMAANNDFAYDDFSHVGYTSIKGYTCQYGFRYKSKTYYVYEKNEKFYVTTSKDPRADVYDLNIETECKRFNDDYGYFLRNATVEGNVLYSKYSAYNYIMNFRKIFNI